MISSWIRFSWVSESIPWTSSPSAKNFVFLWFFFVAQDHPPTLPFETVSLVWSHPTDCLGWGLGRPQGKHQEFSCLPDSLWDYKPSSTSRFPMGSGTEVFTDWALAALPAVSSVALRTQWRHTEINSLFLKLVNKRKNQFILTFWYVGHLA